MSTPLTDAEIANVRSIASDPAQMDVVFPEEILRLLDEVTRSRALLRRIEWGGLNSGACPECGATSAEWYVAGKYSPELNQHESGCELAALIGK